MPFDTSELKTDLFIDGEWTGASNAKRFDVVNPSAETVVASVADASVDDGLRAIDAAEKAADAWRRTTPRERSQILQQCFDLMRRDADELAYLIALENGKSLSDARGEILYAAEFFRWFSEESVRATGEICSAPGNPSKIIVQYQPVGISILITPWNFPAAMATRKIAPALAAGCTCVLKPAEETPLTAYAIANLLVEAGLPAGVVNVITTSDPNSLIEAMIEDTRTRKLSFTGSTEVGSLLLRKASESVMKCSLELGGNAPFVVFDDADMDKAIQGAMIAKMRNGGEACTAANRFIVQKGIHDEFADKLSEQMSRLTLADGTSEESQCGSLINEHSVSKISKLVADAVDRGATVRTGGERVNRKGHFFWPTVLTNVSPDAEILYQEVFGPVAPIVTFETEEEAVSLANDSQFGLVAYVFTEDLARGLRVSEQIEAGMVGLNRGLVSDPAAPFGGMKQSGLGREGAHVGLLEFMEVKYISVDW